MFAPVGSGSCHCLELPPLRSTETGGCDRRFRQGSARRAPMRHTTGGLRGCNGTSGGKETKGGISPTHGDVRVEISRRFRAFLKRGWFDLFICLLGFSFYIFWSEPATSCMYSSTWILGSRIPWRRILSVYTTSSFFCLRRCCAFVLWVERVNGFRGTC